MAYTTINDPTQYFNTVLYTGNSNTNHAVTNTGNSNLQPDWIWVKIRSGQADDHVLVDSSRGNLKRLKSNQDYAEPSDRAEIKSFDSNGFTLGTDDGSSNYNNFTYVAWQWKANGGTTSSNTDGSITSTVQANTTAGFSIVTYTATGSNATVGHGLGVAPKMIIVKNREIVKNWGVWHEELGGGDKYIKLNSGDATSTAIDIWNNTVPTSSVFSIGTASVTNTSGDSHVAYCFAEIKGYSKFGKYTGNGSTDGPFIYTGFKPAFVIFKRTDTGADQWTVVDNKRDIDNPTTHSLFPSGSNSEDNSIGNGFINVDFVSNGIKIRQITQMINVSGSTYIYMAFAESPFVSSDGVSTTAR